MGNKKVSNVLIMSELMKLLRDGPRPWWEVRQIFRSKGYCDEDLETGKHLMNLKLERKRNGYYLRLPNPEELNISERKI